ncbi:MAG: type II and III secretion system protein family protein [Alphaproteobacteria bacterium]|nr:type II and III secretion system protein family protein [Alphaproteobacteria bacterium]
MLKHTLKILSLAILLVGIPAGISQAATDKASLPELGKLARDPMLSIMLGKAEMVDIPGDVSDVLVADPSVVDVMAVKSNRLYLVGASLGETNIMAMDADGNILKRLNVHVQMDTEKLESMLEKLYPDEKITLTGMTDQLVLTGEVSTPSVANSIANLVAQYAAETQGAAASTDDVITNMLTVRGEQQVMLRVKIVEASRSALKDLGLSANQGPSNQDIVSTLTTAPALGLSAPAQLGIMALNYASGSFGPLSFIARALEEEGIVNTLAEPNLTAISGEQAGFLAGGEFPIPTQLDQNGNLVYDFRPFGVSLNFRPLVMSNNRISLEMTTEVSTTSFDQNLQLNGVNIPTFNVRRAQTTVELPSGGTLMIAGLLQSDTISGLTSLPGVNKVPVIGDLVKSDTFQRDESEVVVIVTPYLVSPYGQNNAEMVSDDPIEGPAEAPMPKEPSKLSSAFTENMRRTYGQKTPVSLMKDEGTFGYIMD